jgi:hypothetical protein
MESLAAFFMVVVLSMFALTLASVVLSILVAVRKVPKVVGYVAVGFQAVLSVFAFIMRAEFGYVYFGIFAVCAVLVFVPGQAAKR